MSELLPLAALGRRVVVAGPSNSGKSTLAAALGRTLGVPAVHLDQLYHLPNTNWPPRPRQDFERLHADAIAKEDWAMEGNYFALMGPRLSRATGVVLTGSEPWRGLWRYFRRTLFEHERAGHLEGGQDRLNWRMVGFIILTQPRKRRRDAAILVEAGLPMVELSSMRELNRVYREWKLER